jgi:hypothetical protein
MEGIALVPVEGIPEHGFPVPLIATFLIESLSIVIQVDSFASGGFS